MKAYFLKWLFRLDQEDRQILNILVRCFQNNQRIQSLLKDQKEGLVLNLKYLLSYSLLSIRTNGSIYKSAKADSYMLYYRKSQFKQNLKDWLRYFFIALNVVGLKKLKAVCLRERKIKNLRLEHQKSHHHKDFLYIMFLAQDKSYNSLDALLEIKRFIMDKSDFLNIPIYMETTEERLVPLYARMGFKFYDSHQDKETGITIYFAKYEPFLQTIKQKIAA